MADELQIVIGGGLTLRGWSDRYSYTIISYDNGILKIQRDKNNLPDVNGYTKLLKGYINRHTMKLKWYEVELNQSTGRYKKKDNMEQRLTFGVRDEFWDPDF